MGDSCQDNPDFCQFNRVYMGYITPPVPVTAPMPMPMHMMSARACMCVCVCVCGGGGGMVGCWGAGGVDEHVHRSRDARTGKEHASDAPAHTRACTPTRVNGRVSTTLPDCHLIFSCLRFVVCRYCDGNSFASNRQDPVVVSAPGAPAGTTIWFRGRRNLDAVLATLVDNHNLAVSNCCLAFFFLPCLADLHGAPVGGDNGVRGSNLLAVTMVFVDLPYP